MVLLDNGNIFAIFKIANIPIVKKTDYIKIIPSPEHQKQDFFSIHNEVFFHMTIGKTG